MKKSALHNAHLALNARMTNFAGWRMPIFYSSIIEEHKTVRASVGLFDIDHMGKIEVSGSDCFAFLQHVMSLDLSKITEGDARYSLLCYHDGTIVDDTFIYQLPGRYVIIVNATNNEKVMRWFLYHAQNYNVCIRNLSDSLCMLSLQGPKAEEVLQKTTDVSLHQFEYHSCMESKVAGETAIISRSGYTGEDGFELLIPVAKATDLWNILIESGFEYEIRPIGLGARDTLRFEAKMPLYGHEIGPHTNPFEARLGWAVHLEKNNFLGKQSLLKVRLEGIEKRLIGFEIGEGGIARQGSQIYSNDSILGFVTSGMYSPTLRKKLGLGYVPREYAILGTEIEILVRGKMVKATIVKIPFYEPRKRG